MLIVSVYKGKSIRMKRVKGYQRLAILNCWDSSSKLTGLSMRYRQVVYMPLGNWGIGENEKVHFSSTILPNDQ